MLSPALCTVLLLLILVQSSIAFFTPAIRSRRRFEVHYANENNQESRDKIDQAFREVRAAAETGKRNMISEGSKYISDTEKIIGRVAMMVFSIALVLEFTSGESFLQQFQDGVYNLEKYAGITASAMLGVVILLLGSLRDRL